MAGHTYPHCRVATHPEWYPTESLLPRVLGGKSMDERIQMRKDREAHEAAERARWAAGDLTLFEKVVMVLGLPIVVLGPIAIGIQFLGHIFLGWGFGS